MSRILRLLAIVVVALAAAWSGAWFLVAGMIETRVGGWAEAQRAQGTRVAFGGIAVDGFPMRWRLVATDYESYSIVYSCASVMGFVAMENCWVLAREAYEPGTVEQAEFELKIRAVMAEKLPGMDFNRLAI